MSCCSEISSCSVSGGPGYKSPSEAIKSPREKLIYTVLVHAGKEGQELQPDRLATIDVDPESPTYSQIVHQLSMKYIGDELHHFGWNACSSCCNDPTKKRRFLVLVGLKSSRIYIVDTQIETAPSIHKIIEPEEIKEKVNLSSPHTVS
jgi:selenium-binding protein 1